MTQPENSPQPAGKGFKITLMQGVIGAVSLAGTTAIPIVVQRALTPPSPSPSPDQTSPAQVQPAQVQPAQVQPAQVVPATVSPPDSPAMDNTDNDDENGKGKGKKKNKKHD
ncbi:MAG: hypothetical protein NW224_07645 [Leptolyngbyaceae cyanobacterium bins.302]|nr:hypothetical protein [Leptolyngbyaceae cyanobacterium bins.302]